MDQKGYIMGATAFLMIIPAVLISISLLNVFHDENSINCQSIKSDSISYTFEDIKRNIPLFTRQILENTSTGIIENNKTLTNSSQTIKNELECKINNLTKIYNELNITCIIKSVQSCHTDPFFIEVNSSLCITQDNITHKEEFSQLVSIQGLEDPLPFIKCSPYGLISHNQTHILYGSSLEDYLKNQNINNSIYYQNATSPFIIKKCPYDPYSTHSTPNTLRNCLDNGYYHESEDGSCYLCRLEGRGTCPHYGIETFILPSPIINSSDLNHMNASCSVDHVIFGSNNYPGDLITYFQENYTIHVLFLEEGHKSKYGLIKN